MSSVDRSESRPLTQNDFGYLDLDHGLDEWPYLALGFEHSQPSFHPQPSLTPQLRWLRVEHETRGPCCGVRFLTVTLLRPTEPAAAAMVEIADRWHGSELGCHGLGATLEEILAYRRQLQSLLGEDCQSSFRLLEEALYPIDIGPTTLANVCTDQFPGDLATLAEGISQPFWSIFVLGLNS